jgi:Protein of unknown function (DUF4235)
MLRIGKKALLWKVVTLACATVAGLVTERALVVAFERSLSRAAPRDPADRRTPWPEALSWAAATGVGVGVARAIARRSAAAVWEAATDEAPPGVEAHEAV